MSMNKILIVIDGSYFSYYTLFAATRRWSVQDPDSYNHWVKPAKETDQKNLPNILNSDVFRKYLKEATMKKLEAVDWVIKDNFQDDFNDADRVDFLFARDDDINNSFRKKLYREYKAQRAVAPKQFQVRAARDYVVDVIFKELDVEKRYGYKLLKVDGAEGDDVIACALRNATGYSKKFLIASDHDFLQIDGVVQFGLDGKQVERRVNKKLPLLAPKDYLLYKIILGDQSDNIGHVFDGCGPVNSAMLVSNRDELKRRLKADQLAAKQFLLNKKLISFDEMPKDLEERVTKQVNEALYCEEPLNGGFCDILKF